jgi:hypothetical protein
MSEQIMNLRVNAIQRSGQVEAANFPVGPEHASPANSLQKQAATDRES